MANYDIWTQNTYLEMTIIGHKKYISLYYDNSQLTLHKYVNGMLFALGQPL